MSQELFETNLRQIELTALTTGIVSFGVSMGCFAMAIGVAILRYQLTLTGAVADWDPFGTAVAIGVGLLLGVIGWDRLSVGTAQIENKFIYIMFGEPSRLFPVEELHGVARAFIYNILCFFLMLPYGAGHRIARLAPVIGGNGHRVFTPDYPVGSAVIVMLELMDTLSALSVGCFVIALVSSILTEITRLEFISTRLDRNLTFPAPVPTVVVQREQQDMGSEESGEDKEKTITFSSYTPSAEVRSHTNDFAARLCVVGILVTIITVCFRRVVRVVSSVGFTTREGHFVALGCVVLLFPIVSFLYGFYFGIQIYDGGSVVRQKFQSVVVAFRRVVLYRVESILGKGVIASAYTTMGLWGYLASVARLPANRAEGAVLFRLARLRTQSCLVESSVSHAYAEVTRISSVVILCAATVLMISWVRLVRRSDWSDSLGSPVSHAWSVLTLPIIWFMRKFETGEIGRQLSRWSFWIKMGTPPQLIFICLSYLSVLRGDLALTGVILSYIVSIPISALIYLESDQDSQFSRGSQVTHTLVALLVPGFGSCLYVIRAY